MTGSIAAVRAACQKTRSFTMPEGCTLISRQKPHLSGLIAADWSRMLRKRDTENPDDPEKDAPKVDPSKIIYFDDKVEEIVVTGKKIRQKAATTYLQPALTDEQRAVPTDRYNRTPILRTALAVFEKWRDGTSAGTQTKY